MKRRAEKNIGLQKGRKSLESVWKGRKEGTGRKKKVSPILSNRPRV